MAEHQVVQALTPFAANVRGVTFMVAKGELFYDDDPVVKANSKSFGSLHVRSSSGATARPSSGSVETASSEPGVRRRLSKTPKTDPEPSEV